MKDQGQLTPRQVQVIELMAQGLSAKQIGDRLGTTVSTVNTQQWSAYKRLGAVNSAQCVALFLTKVKPTMEPQFLPCDL